MVCLASTRRVAMVRRMELRGNFFICDALVQGLYLGCIGALGDDSRSRRCLLDVPGNNASVRARTRYACQVDATLARQPSRKGSYGGSACKSRRAVIALPGF